MPSSNRSILPGLLVFLSVAIPAAAVNMTLQKTADGSAAGVTPPAGLRWVYFAHHTHTDYSDGRDTVKNRILEAASFGAQSISICDHNTIAQCSDPWFVEQDGCIPMRGDEWGGMGRGHACVLNMTGSDPLDVKPNGTLYTVEEMIPQMLARGGTIFINHPFDDGNAWPTGFAQAGIRGVGAWTTPFPNADARGWWAAHINAGRMLVAIGESDHHLEKWLSTGVSNSLMPCNYVLAASNQPADIQAAVEAGRISIAASKGAARAFVWCDQNGDGVYETPMGADVTVTQPKRLRFRVEVYDGALLGNVMVYSRSAGVKYTIGSGTPWRMDFEADVTSETKDFIRAELRDTFGVFQSLTNPIYVNHALTCSAAAPSSPASGSPTAFTLTFNRPVTGLTAAGVDVTNGTAGALTTTDQQVYSLSVTPAAQGVVTCRVRANAAFDAVGNGNLESNSASLLTDTVPPTGTILINGNRSATNNRNVTLALTWDDGGGSGVVRMRFSDNGANWTLWEPLAATRPYTMPTGADGHRTVRVQFLDRLNNRSLPYHDYIRLDTTPPTGTIIINGGALSTANPTVTLGLTWDDGAGSLVSRMRFSDDGAHWTPWEPPAAVRAHTLPATAGYHTVRVQYLDGAGNYSAVFNDYIKLLLP